MHWAWPKVIKRWPPSLRANYITGDGEHTAIIIMIFTASYNMFKFTSRIITHYNNDNNSLYSLIIIMFRIIFYFNNNN